MAAIFQTLFLILARSTRDQLIQQVQYLKVENHILRSRLPRQIQVTPAERSRLLKFGRLVGPAIKELISIVHPSTFARWFRERDNLPPQPRANRGRPRTKQFIRELILRMALENIWGYTRIKGELIKLGLPNVGRTTIQNVLKEAGYDPGPYQGPSTWDDFITRHAKTLWACDQITAGQAHESTALEPLLIGADESLFDHDGEPIAWPVALAGDKGYRAD